MNMEPETKRLLTSRKIWGAVLGSIAIIVITVVAKPEIVSHAITTLGVLWGAAIAGQAAKDYIDNKKDQP